MGILQCIICYYKALVCKSLVKIYMSDQIGKKNMYIYQVHASMGKKGIKSNYEMTPTARREFRAYPSHFTFSSTTPTVRRFKKYLPWLCDMFNNPSVHSDQNSEYKKVKSIEMYDKIVCLLVSLS